MMVASINRDALAWRVATKSASANCVEVARVDSCTVAFRNSRRPDEEMLTYTDAEFDAFIKAIKNGEFDNLS